MKYPKNVLRASELTTGDVGRVFGFSIRNVIRASDRGLIKCHRVPGSPHRRFALEEICNLARENDQWMRGFLCFLDRSAGLDTRGRGRRDFFFFKNFPRNFALVKIEKAQKFSPSHQNFQKSGSLFHLSSFFMKSVHYVPVFVRKSSSSKKI